MNIGVILVSFNRIEKLKIALDCYDKQTFQPAYILVVNNGSTDGTGEFLSSWQVSSATYDKYVISMEHNTGGAGGFYEGFKKAMVLDAEWIWVSDDDAYPRPDAFEKLSDCYKSISEEKQQKLSVLCSAVINDGQIHYGHRNRLSVSPLRVRFVHSVPEDYNKKFFSFDIFSYVGTCIRKSALQTAGLTAPDFFIYRDDQEHSIRLRKTGVFICVPDSRVDHDTPPFNKKILKWGNYYFARNMLILLKMYFPFHYFLLRFIKGYIRDASFLSKNTAEMKALYKAAFIDALFNRSGIHSVYKPGWTPHEK